VFVRGGGGETKSVCDKEITRAGGKLNRGRHGGRRTGISRLRARASKVRRRSKAGLDRISKKILKGDAEKGPWGKN